MEGGRKNGKDRELRERKEVRGVVLGRLGGGQERAMGGESVMGGEVVVGMGREGEEGVTGRRRGLGSEEKEEKVIG
ncbi:hypothetical protein M8J76_014830 [Diaphorina citri]|nr:hypothetical protein M8J76_014830 [Diaphorina citri]